MALLVVAWCLVGVGRQARAQAPAVQEVTYEQLLDAVRGGGATLAVVNFWATWCAPCLEEFPYFIRLGKDLADQGVDVFFVSMDFEEERPAVQAFLAEQGWRGPAFLRVGKDDAFIAGIHPAWSGVLPATVLYSRDGSPVDFWQGTPVGYEALRDRVAQALQR